MIHPSDRRTDGRSIAYTRYSTYAVARKNPKIIKTLFVILWFQNQTGEFKIVNDNNDIFGCEDELGRLQSCLSGVQY